MKRRKFIIIADNTMVNYDTFYDLYLDKRCGVLGSYKKHNNRILDRTEHAYLNRNLPFKSILISNRFINKQIIWQDDTEYYFLCLDFAPYIAKQIQKKQKDYKIKFILLVMNVLLQAPRTLESIKTFPFDYIFTFDQGDAEKYRFCFFDTFYSVIPNNKKSESKEDIHGDIYYVGRCKDRLTILNSIFSELKENKLTGIFRITGVPKKEQFYNKEILYNRSIPYKKVVEELKQCNCILEILTSGQTGATLRYYEAVCYNKKLLTNNKNVLNLPFYNPKYMHVFEKPEDIDWNWVKERIPIDYHYDGRFSPTHLIDRIIEFEDEKEREQNVKTETP